MTSVCEILLKYAKDRTIWYVIDKKSLDYYHVIEQL